MGKKLSRAEGLREGPPAARVVGCRPPPPQDLRQRFLNILGLKINHEHAKWFVRVR